MKFTSASANQTFSFAKKFAMRLKGGEVIGLIGRLGAGKTIFTKGLASGLGLKKNITSPTFVLMRVYSINSPQIKRLVHIDAYRTRSARDLAAIGAHEYFNNTDTVTIIEWADKIKKILPKRTRLIKIINRTSDKRIINY